MPRRAAAESDGTVSGLVIMASIVFQTGGFTNEFTGKAACLSVGVGSGGEADCTGGPALAVQPNRLTLQLNARLHKEHGPPLNPSVA